MRVDRDTYVELVLSVVEQVPAGRVTTYGAVAEAVGPVTGGGGPRLVGTVLSQHGGGVPWWRVVRADGSLPPSHQGEALERYRVEGTPMRSTAHTRTRVDLAAARWTPPRLPHPDGSVDQAAQSRE